MKKTLLYLIFAFAITFAKAQIFEYEGINYNVINALNVEVGLNQGYNNSELVIPARVKYNGNTYTVTGITTQAFSNVTSLNYLDIPTTVTSIGSKAFSNCTGLNKLILNGKIPLNIGYDEIVDIFDGVDSQNVELYVPSLSKYGLSDWRVFSYQVINTFTDGKFRYSVIDENTVYFAMQYGLPLLEGHVTIPKNVSYKGRNYAVKGVDNNAFIDQIYMTSLKIPSTITQFGSQVFVNCPNLQTIYSFIDDYYLPKCNDYGVSIEPVEFLVPVELYDSYVSNYFYFNNCSFILNQYNTLDDNDIRFRYYMTSDSTTKINVFINLNDPSSLPTSISIPNSYTDNVGEKYIVDEISYNYGDGFAYLYTLNSVIIPSSIKKIDYYAFKNAVNLTSVTVDWQTPLLVNRNVFGNIDLSKTTLYVPAGTEAAYSTADVWKEFGSVQTKVITNVNTNDASLFDIYPNPASDMLTVKLNNNEVVEAVVFNNNGNAVLNQTLNNACNVLNINYLPSGLYLLKLNTNNGTYSKKIVKQ